MATDLNKWQTQIRKGYLELCVLTLIGAKQKLFGFDLLRELEAGGTPVKEGTLYPLLNRMHKEGSLSSDWQLEGAKGHPRKYYFLSPKGEETLEQMQLEFEQLFDHYRNYTEMESKNERVSLRELPQSVGADSKGYRT